MDRNLYWSEAGARVAEAFLREWRGRGYDARSVVLDPGCGALLAGRGAAPCAAARRAAGIRPIALSGFGPRPGRGLTE
jgi:hypothetical protein